MLHAHLAALALAAAMFSASGCGSSSKTESTTTSAATPQSTTTAPTVPAPTSREEVKVQAGKPLSRAAWIAQGDAICSRANIKLSSTTAKTQQDFARLLPQAAAYERAEATELSKLVPPTATASDWQQVVVGIQKFGEFSARAGEYARVNNFNAALPIATAGNNAQRQFTAIAKRDGFKVCSLP